MAHGGQVPVMPALLPDVTQAYDKSRLLDQHALESCAETTENWARMGAIFPMGCP